MSKQLRVISIGFPFESAAVVSESLASDRALFDFDVVVIRPPQLDAETSDRPTLYRYFKTVMERKKRELESLLLQGGVLVLFLDVPDFYRVQINRYGSNSSVSVNNYDFLDETFAACLRSGTGNQIAYDTSAEPFVSVLKKSIVAWTAYVTKMPAPPFNSFKFFARAGVAGYLAGKMAYKEGHIVLLPNLSSLDERSFLDACAEYRFTRQGTTPPDWADNVPVPGLSPIENAIADLDKQMSDLQRERLGREVEREERAAYRKLLYEKGKAQLEPIVLRALDDLDFGTSPGGVIEGTIHEIDGRTSKGSSTGIVEVKGSKNQIAQSEFSPFVTKILADAEVKKKYSKGILVGNGLFETEPSTRLGDSVFTPHVLDGAKRNSVALINSVELYWLCCALLRGEPVDKDSVREAILSGNGYVDLKPFSGDSPFRASAGGP